MRPIKTILIAVVLATLAFAEYDYYTISFPGPITPMNKDSITAEGLEIVGYEGNFTYLVRAPKGELALTLASMPSDAKIKRRVNKTAEVCQDIKTGKKLERVSVILYEGEDTDAILSKVGSILPAEKHNGQVIELKNVSYEQIMQVAAIPGVMGIWEQKPMGVFNDYAAPVLGVTAVRAALNLSGNDFIVAVADTGLDTGNISTVHLDFRGRVVRISGWCDGRAGCTGNPTGRDLSGHGTHVAGSVLGNGTVNSSLSGMAPRARLFFQSLNPDGSNSIYLPSDLRDIFTEAKNEGARIHTNSWGDDDNGYSQWAYYTDYFTNVNKNFTILFAAGNWGPLFSTISSQANAKNSITIGSVGTTRFGGDPSQISSFSSRGPAADGRIKPDLVAPGEDILSTKSSLVGPDPCGWGSYDSNYCYCEGTSMATPLSAGSATLVYEYLKANRSWGNASSALVKAVLVAGADEISGYGSIPNNVVGFGRINVSRSVASNVPYIMNFSDRRYALATGGSATFNFRVVNSSVPLRAVLAWTDKPCTSNCDSSALVNDLDIKVVMPDESWYYGNTAQINASVSNADGTNNLERVNISNPQPGTYTVNVSAYNVPLGPQDFSLVVLGGLTDGIAPGLAISSPANSTYNLDYIPLNFTVTDSSGVSACWYSLDDEVNVSLPNCTNTTLPALANGRHNITLYANDTECNVGYANVSFLVNKTSPNISIRSPSNMARYYSNSTDLNYSVVEPAFGVDSCWYSLDGNLNVTLTGCENATLENLSHGTHTLVLYSNNTLGNVGSASSTFSIVTDVAVWLSLTSNEIWTRRPRVSAYYTVLLDNLTNATCFAYNSTGNAIANRSISKNGTYYFALSAGPTNGIYNFTILCYPPNFAYKNVSAGLLIYYDGIRPNITANFTDSYFNSTLLNLTYNAYDNLAPYLNCTLSAGGWIYNVTGIPANSSRTEEVNFTRQGRNSVRITCTDYTRNSGRLNARVSIDTVAPNITIRSITPSPYPNANGSRNTTISYYVYDRSALNITTYSIDGLLNGSLGTGRSGTLRLPLDAGSHSLVIDSWDAAFNQGTREQNFTVP